MKAPIHSVDNPRPFMPWDDRSCCLKCSPQWLPRWHMHGRRDSFLWTHYRLTAHLPGPGLKFARKSSNPRNEKFLDCSCSVLQAAAFNLWFIIFGTWNRWVLIRACLVNSFLVVVVMRMMVVEVAVITSKSHVCQQAGCLLHCHIHPNHALTSSKNQPICVKRRGSFSLDFVGLSITPDIFI